MGLSAILSCALFVAFLLLNCEANTPLPKVFVSINSMYPKAIIDDDFLCVTMDWWPPEKCDYGTCAWGNSGVLNNDFS